jgi:hypothetical protein
MKGCPTTKLVVPIGRSGSRCRLYPRRGVNWATVPRSNDQKLLWESYRITEERSGARTICYERKKPKKAHGAVGEPCCGGSFRYILRSLYRPPPLPGATDPTSTSSTPSQATNASLSTTSSRNSSPSHLHSGHPCGIDALELPQHRHRSLYQTNQDIFSLHRRRSST